VRHPLEVGGDEAKRRGAARWQTGCERGGARCAFGQQRAARRSAPVGAGAHGRVDDAQAAHPARDDERVDAVGPQPLLDPRAEEAVRPGLSERRLAGRGRAAKQSLWMMSTPRMRRTIAATAAAPGPP
jgi:hypothetical protein